MVSVVQKYIPARNQPQSGLVVPVLQCMQGFVDRGQSVGH